MKCDFKGRQLTAMTCIPDQAVYPIAVSIRSTNVYEEKSMGAPQRLTLCVYEAFG